MGVRTGLIIGGPHMHFFQDSPSAQPQAIFSPCDPFNSSLLSRLSLVGIPLTSISLFQMTHGGALLMFGVVETKSLQNPILARDSVALTKPNSFASLNPFVNFKTWDFKMLGF